MCPMAQRRGECVIDRTIFEQSSLPAIAATTATRRTVRSFDDPPMGVIREAGLEIMDGLSIAHDPPQYMVSCQDQIWRNLGDRILFQLEDFRQGSPQYVPERLGDRTVEWYRAEQLDQVGLPEAS